jgi:hypothetical protein
VVEEKAGSGIIRFNLMFVNVIGRWNLSSWEEFGISASIYASR